MAEFFITRKEVCPECEGRGYARLNESPAIGKPCPNAAGNRSLNEVSVCVQGTLYSEANLLDVLKKLRWTEHNSLQDIRYEELRIEDAE